MTKATLTKALTSLPALAAQLKYDKDPVRVKEDLIEAQAAEDPIDAQIVLSSRKTCSAATEKLYRLIA